MRNRSRILRILLVVCVLGGVAWWAFKPREPVYNGKTLSQWLTQAHAVMFLGPGPKADWLEASNSVRQIGANAIPALLRMMQKKDSVLILKLIAVSEKHSSLGIKCDASGYTSPIFHYEPASFAQAHAALGFQFIGADASNAVPDLIRIYKMNLSQNSRLSVAYALGGVGPTAKEAVPFLMEAATNSDLGTRDIALTAIGSIHAQPQVVVPFLIATVTNATERIQIRISAARAVLRYGIEARQAAPDLLVELIQIEREDKSIAKQTSKRQLADAVKRALQAIDPETAAKVLGGTNETSSQTVKP